MGLYDKYIAEIDAMFQMKTPYQLDLETMGRKPDVIPKVGDKVKIKSREWYEKWKNPEGSVKVLYAFIGEMAKYCGRVLTVKEVSLGAKSWRFRLEEDEKEKSWSLEMFEEVYPQGSSKKEECVKAVSAIPAINPTQGIGVTTNWGKVFQDTSAIFALPHNCLDSSIPSTHERLENLRTKWGLNKEPELQTIKRHRFIKLEKL